jgi:hypothetical protein
VLKGGVGTLLLSLVGVDLEMMVEVEVGDSALQGRVT